MITAVEYATRYLEKELAIVSRSLIEYPFLSTYEQAIIYKYTDDGFDTLNESLRKDKGIIQSDFGNLLENILQKVPVYEGYGFRGVNLNREELGKYVLACENERSVTEFSFLSASKSGNMAKQFGKVFFEIYSENWKDIAPISKHITEKEVILSANSTFEVLSYRVQGDFYIFKMIEI